MSTLPFLLSVADELDNINSQSYMDDFGLGFHPHRQFYRTPTIQLSLPSNTDWMQERQQRYRHKFVDETQNNVQDEADEEYDPETQRDADRDETIDNHRYRRDQYSYDADNEAVLDPAGASTSAAAAEAASGSGGGGGGGPASGARKCRSALNSNPSKDESVIDNLNKKCCKNYYRHANSHAMCPNNKGGHEKSSVLHSKCLEGNNSSSDESLQKVSSSIEFLTCFLLKKSRASKHHGGHGASKKS